MWFYLPSRTTEKLIIFQTKGDFRLKISLIIHFLSNPYQFDHSRLFFSGSRQFHSKSPDVVSLFVSSFHNFRFRCRFQSFTHRTTTWRRRRSWNNNALVRLEQPVWTRSRSQSSSSNGKCKNISQLMTTVSVKNYQSSKIVTFSGHIWPLFKWAKFWGLMDH